MPSLNEMESFDFDNIPTATVSKFTQEEAPVVPEKKKEISISKTVSIIIDVIAESEAENSRIVPNLVLDTGIL